MKDRPTAIVSKTKKGFGILPLLEQEGDVNYHGKALSKPLAEKALQLIGEARRIRMERRQQLKTDSPAKAKTRWRSGKRVG